MGVEKIMQNPAGLTLLFVREAITLRGQRVHSPQTLEFTEYYLPFH